jgi:hypothetical protein
MRIVVLLAALALVAGCGEDDETEAPASTPALADLTVVVNDGSDEKTADIQCDGATDSDVCGAVADLESKTFEPVPGNVACTQQYGGPETATVSGTLRGEPVDAKFSRENGCEIERWEAAKPLFDAAE